MVMGAVHDLPQSCLETAMPDWQVRRWGREPVGDRKMSEATDLERYMQGLINAERAAHGLQPLTLELNLNSSADAHSDWMVQADTFSHTGANNSSPTARMIAAGLDLSGGWGTAENIAAVSVSGHDSYYDEIDRLHQNLMNSPGHRANILDPDLEYLGIGVSIGPLTYSSGQRYDSVFVTQNFAHTGGVVDLDLQGSAAGDALSGGQGDDLLAGLGGADTLTGARGDDTLRGGGGTDTAVIGADRDTAEVTQISGGVQIRSGDGTDQLFDIEHVAFADQTVAVADLFSSGSDPVVDPEPDADPDPVSPEDPDGDNEVIGGAGADTLSAGRGNDTVTAGSGNDAVWGDGGDDLIDGGAGNDTLRGGREADTILGGEGDDQLRGQRHGDELDGGSGNDDLKGGGGNDVILGGIGNDFLKGGTRHDLLEGGAGDDTLVGNSHNDTLQGGSGADLLNAGGGDDVLEGGTGNDVIKGGAGADVFVFDTGHGQDTVQGFAAGEDMLEISAALAQGQSAGDIADGARLVSGAVEISLGTGDVIRLEGMNTLTGLEDVIDIA